MGIPGRQKGKCLCFLVFQVAPAVLLSPPNPQCNAISASIPSAATPGLSARLFINLLVPGRPSGDPVPAGKLLLSSWKMIPGVTIIFPVIVGKHVKMSIGIRRNVAKPPPPTTSSCLLWWPGWLSPAADQNQNLEVLLSPPSCSSVYKTFKLSFSLPPPPARLSRGCKPIRPRVPELAEGSVRAG